MSIALVGKGLQVLKFGGNQYWILEKYSRSQKVAEWQDNPDHPGINQITPA
jgi:hypothetical protein